VVGFALIYALWVIVFTILAAMFWALLPESKFMSLKSRMIWSGVSTFFTYLVIGFGLI